MTPTKPCKATGCPKRRYGTAGHCYSHYRERERIKRQERAARKLERRLGSKKHQESERKKWHRKTWVLMSEWVRRKGADSFGMVTCFTCPNRFHWKKMQAGHRHHRTLDFDARNIHPQCWTCNGKQSMGGKSGNLGEYEHRLALEHGIEWCAKLKLDAGTHLGYTIGEIKAIHALLTIELENL